jgi:hypothetical protein
MNPKVGVVGCFQNGKSTLVNCLLDGYFAPTGDGLPTTHLATRYTYGEIETVTLKRPNGTEEPTGLHAFMENYQHGNLCDFTEAIITVHRPLLKDVDLIDTPGFDANRADEERALAAVKESDFALLVLSNKGWSQPEGSVLRQIREITKSRTPCAILVNCCDQQRWDPASVANEKIAGEIQAEINAAGLIPLEVVAGHLAWRCNLAWFWQASGHLEREIQLCKSQSSQSERQAQGSLRMAQDLQEDVERFWEKQPSRTNPLERARRSRFLEVRDGLRECFWKSLSITEPAVSRVLSECVEGWRTNMRGGVESAKERLVK